MSGTIVGGLNPADVVSINIVIGPTSIASRNFGVLMIVGSSSIIDTTQRFRTYTNLTGVIADFGVNTPEYFAAQRVFQQSPPPAQIMIGRWAQTATSAILHGGILSAAQQLMSNFNTITTGGMSITIDGTAVPLTGLNFAAATNLSMVAAVINTALSTHGTCTWDGQKFNIQSSTTGVTSTISYATVGTGTDISSLLQLRTGQAQVPISGIVAESAISCVSTLATMSNGWYGIVFANNSMLADSDRLLIAAYIEGAQPSRMFGYTTAASAELVTPNTTSLGYQLSALLYSKTTWIYSSSDPYAIAGYFGRLFSTNFLGSLTALTMKFKQVIGAAAETITESQASALAAIGGNVFVNYNNGAAILQQGTQANGRFTDEVYGLDWLQDYCQVAMFNAFYTSTTKIPQTDPGMTTLLTALETALEQGVVNGFMAPGQWNAGGFGQLSQGDTLGKGYYTYSPPISSQTQSVRETRAAPPIQAAIKLAGAFHSASVILNVNR